MKVYCVKYCTTAGIVERDVNGENQRGYVYKSLEGGGLYQGKLGKDCFESKAEAIANAYSIVDTKIKSHERAIARLKAIRF